MGILYNGTIHALCVVQSKDVRNTLVHYRCWWAARRHGASVSRLVLASLIINFYFPMLKQTEDDQSDKYAALVDRLETGTADIEALLLETMGQLEKTHLLEEETVHDVRELNAEQLRELALKRWPDSPYLLQHDMCLTQLYKWRTPADGDERLHLIEYHQLMDVLETRWFEYGANFHLVQPDLDFQLVTRDMPKGGGLEVWPVGVGESFAASFFPMADGRMRLYVCRVDAPHFDMARKSLFRPPQFVDEQQFHIALKTTELEEAYQKQRADVDAWLQQQRTDLQPMHEENLASKLKEAKLMDPKKLAEGEDGIAKICAAIEEKAEKEYESKRELLTKQFQARCRQVDSDFRTEAAKRIVNNRISQFRAVSNLKEHVIHWRSTKVVVPTTPKFASVVRNTLCLHLPDGHWLVAHLSNVGRECCVLNLPANNNIVRLYAYRPGTDSSLYRLYAVRADNAIAVWLNQPLTTASWDTAKSRIVELVAEPNYVVGCQGKPTAEHVCWQDDGLLTWGNEDSGIYQIEGNGSNLATPTSFSNHWPTAEDELKEAGKRGEPYKSPPREPIRSLFVAPCSRRMAVTTEHNALFTIDAKNVFILRDSDTILSTCVIGSMGVVLTAMGVGICILTGDRPGAMPHVYRLERMEDIGTTNAKFNRNYQAFLPRTGRIELLLPNGAACRMVPYESEDVRLVDLANTLLQDTMKADRAQQTAVNMHRK